MDATAPFPLLPNRTHTILFEGEKQNLGVYGVDKGGCFVFLLAYVYIGPLFFFYCFFCGTQLFTCMGEAVFPCIRFHGQLGLSEPVTRRIFERMEA